MKTVRMFLLILLLPLMGCAPVTLVDSWKAQPSPEKCFRNFLVVGVSGNTQNRQILEGVMSAELKKKGVTAYPSYTLTDITEPLSRSAIENAAGEITADAVIATRLVRLDNEKQGRVGYVMTDRGKVGYTSYATFDMKPVEVTTSMTYVLETNLFDATTQTLVWSGAINVVDPQGIITLSEKFSTLVVDTLKKEGFLP